MFEDKIIKLRSNIKKLNVEEQIDKNILKEVLIDITDVLNGLSFYINNHEDNLNRMDSVVESLIEDDVEYYTSNKQQTH